MEPSKEDSFKQYLFGKTVTLNKAFSSREIDNLISEAGEIQRNTEPPSLDQILKVFSKLSAAWTDPNYSYRKKAHDALLQTSGLNEASIIGIMEKLPYFISPEYFLKKIEGEFGYTEILDKPVWQEATNSHLLAAPLGTVLHVGAGNTFIGGLESLLESIITKNINIFKMSSNDRVFPIIFAESIRELDDCNVISKRFSVIWWSGGDITVENAFKKYMDCIFFWGGYDSLSNWKNDLSTKTSLIDHGPKISFGVISKDGLCSSGIDDLAYRIAVDVISWEQKACSCPHVIFYESNISSDKIEEFLNALKFSFEKINSEFPPGPRTDDENVEVIKSRELTLARSFMTDSRISVIGPKTLDWTILFFNEIEDQELKLSPLNRTIIIRPFSSLEHLKNIMIDHSFYLQTVGYCFDKSEITKFSQFLSSLGVLRICQFGKMSIPTAGCPHDGRYSLRDLTKMVVLE